jgi:hypothetical protein
VGYHERTRALPLSLSLSLSLSLFIFFSFNGDKRRMERGGKENYCHSVRFPKSTSRLRFMSEGSARATAAHSSIRGSSSWTNSPFKLSSPAGSCHRRAFSFPSQVCTSGMFLPFNVEGCFELLARYGIGPSLSLSFLASEGNR